ncbi:MAG: hypothetical protein ACE5R6_18105 [Candidatus Heimdallarchaeota archaeon]
MTPDMAYQETLMAAGRSGEYFYEIRRISRRVRLKILIEADSYR